MYSNSLARHFFMFHAKCLLLRLDRLLPVRSYLQNFYQCSFFLKINFEILSVIKSHVSFSDSGQCQDSSQYELSCPGWKWACTVDIYVSFMQSNCQKSCGWCPGNLFAKHLTFFEIPTYIILFFQIDLRCTVATTNQVQEVL